MLTLENNKSRRSKGAALQGFIDLILGLDIDHDFPDNILAVSGIGKSNMIPNTDTSPGNVMHASVYR